MKHVGLPLLAIVLCCGTLSAQTRHEIHIPDLKNYQTLKCDFHLHTVFSDGTVWPTVRVDEAYREGLDAIALTEHIEYRPHQQDIQASHNRAFEIAQKAAQSRNILLIPGSEITRSMPPGHSNALFISDADSLDRPEYRDAFAAAKRQNAFIFWNHPSWDAQQPDTTLWWDAHTELLENGCMQGIEVVNYTTYSPEAHQWCLDKKLTLLGNSDSHQPMQTDLDFLGTEHRPMTLVFAKERSVEGIREALFQRRTAVYFGENLIGEAIYLREIFENALEIKNIKKSEKSVSITLFNHSDLVFHLKKTEHDPKLIYPRAYTLRPNCEQTITIHLEQGVRSGEVNFEVTNLWVAPNQALQYTFKI